MIDISPKIKLVQTIASAKITGDKTGDTIVDTQGYESACVVVIPSAVGTISASHYFTVNVSMGDDSALSDGANLAAADFADAAIPTIKAATAGTPLIYGLAPTDRERYMRVDLKETGAADLTCSVFILLANPRHDD